MSPVGILFAWIVAAVLIGTLGVGVMVMWLWNPFAGMMGTSVIAGAILGAVFSVQRILEVGRKKRKAE